MDAVFIGLAAMLGAGVFVVFGPERAIWGLGSWCSDIDPGTDIALGLESAALIG